MLQSPVSRSQTVAARKSSAGESVVSLSAEHNASRPSKKRKEQQGISSYEEDIDTQAAVAPAAVRLTKLKRQHNTSRNHQSETDRLHVARLKRQEEWQERKNNLRERSAWLDIDLKKIEVSRQRLVYLTELDARYRDLRQQQNRPYAEIANLFPEMIELFPPEEKDKFK